MRLNQLHLTKYKINFPFTDHTKAVRKAWIKDEVNEKWAAGIWAQKIAAKRKVCKMYNIRTIFREINLLHGAMQLLNVNELSCSQRNYTGLNRNMKFHSTSMWVYDVCSPISKQFNPI
jgi:hypothetical protein